ncbi:hypothetical protein AeRB84_006680 [Aphanomyces euteiches]|nr:hypothetical protein AeRB84_006680 [Aphanomyces euteiches]
MPRTNRQSHSVPTDGKIVRRNLGDDERQKVYRLLLERSVEGKLKHGTIAIVLRIVGCHWRTVSRLWAQARASIDKGSLVADVAVKRKGNPGAKSRRSSDEVEEAKSVALDDRQTLRSTAEKSGIPKTTILRHMKTSSILRARSNHVKPILTTKNQVWRVRHAMSLLLPQLCGGHIFANMRDFVHIDEKWFNITKVKRRFYAYNNEALALRRVQSTKFITKVMFLAAVSRPHYDHHKKQYFDGKIGIWPFAKTVQAKRPSKNRAKGTPVTVLQNVDTAAYRDMILHNVVPAIYAKMPRDSAIVKLQQDNASPQRCICNAQLRDHGIMNIEVVNQPANSPDFNVFDLGIFNSIQKLQQ